jgi:hypothetical protein
MLLKMEKDVNACLGGLQGVLPFGNTFRKNFSQHGKKKCNNGLAHGVGCGRLAAITAPLSDSWDVRAAAVGRAENFYAGGRAARASFFWWSSG